MDMNDLFSIADLFGLGNAKGANHDFGEIKLDKIFTDANIPHKMSEHHYFG